MQDFGTRLRQLRRARDLTQVELAALIGRCQPDISEMERGLITPTIPTILKLAKALRAEPIDLLGEIVSRSRA